MRQPGCGLGEAVEVDGACCCVSRGQEALLGNQQVCVTQLQRQAQPRAHEKWIADQVNDVVVGAGGEVPQLHREAAHRRAGEMSTTPKAPALELQSPAYATRQPRTTAISCRARASVSLITFSAMGAPSHTAS